MTKQRFNLDGYLNRIEMEQKHIRWVKKLYSDQKTFNGVMEKLISRDYNSFIRVKDGNSNTYGNWRVLFTILTIVMEDGEFIKPFDVITKMTQSLSIKYYGWVFSWVHDETTVISIYEPNGSLIYRF